MRLREHLALRAADEPVLLHGGQTFTAAEILDAATAARSKLPRGGVWHAAGGDDLELIVGLVAADGWAAQIVLDALPCPADVRKKGTGTSHSCELAERNGHVLGAIPLFRCDTRWVLATSGTTGEPKWIQHTLATLTRSVKIDRAKGAGVRWGLVYDARRFAGLQVVLQALLGGSSLVVPRDRCDYLRIVTEFQRHGVNALSATPSCWRKLLMAGIADAVDLRYVTLGGEIADAAILTALGQALPAARITHIYATTEAGVGFAVRDGREGFPASWLEQPPSDVEFKIAPNGELYLRPPRSAGASGSYGDAEWIATGDLVAERGGRCYFLGRADGVINVGGDKVHPKEIEDAALAVRGVALAKARARANPIVGQVPELFVEATRGVDHDTLRAVVWEQCRAVLLRNKWPAVVHVVDKLDLSEAGKLV